MTAATRLVSPLAPPAGLYESSGWHGLTPRLSARALAQAETLPSEGARLAIGAPRYPSESDMPLVARPRYLVHGRDCLIVGQRALIDPEAARLVNDTLLLPEPFFDHQTPLSRFPREFHMTPAASREGEQLRLQDGAPGAVIAEPVVALSSTEARNYGSWLFRILPKLLMLDRLGPEAEGRTLLLPLEQPFMREIAATFAPGWTLIAQDVTGITALADVLLPSLPAPSNIVPPDVRARLVAFAEACRQSPASPHPTRLYVSRRNWSETVGRRRLVNEDALADLLASEGFAEIWPENMSLEERAAAFASAEIVVGPTGSGLFNAVFCRPGTRIAEFEPHSLFRSMHGNLYRSLGLVHSFLRGEISQSGPASDSPNPHADWRLDVGAARALVVKLGVAKTHRVIDPSAIQPGFHAS